MTQQAADRPQSSLHTPTHAVLDAVASEEGVDSALTLTPPLAQVVNPEMLDAFVNGSQVSGEVRFPYRNYEVTVTGDGDISVQSKAEPQPSG